jgi:hypothetical protein
VYFDIFSTRFGCIFPSSPLVSSVVFTSSPLVSSLVSRAYVWQYLEANGELDMFYEAREVVRGKTTLETRGEDVKTTLETRGEVVKLQSKRVEKMYKLHSKRVDKM